MIRGLGLINILQFNEAIVSNKAFQGNANIILPGQNL